MTPMLRANKQCDVVIWALRKRGCKSGSQKLRLARFASEWGVDCKD